MFELPGWRRLFRLPSPTPESAAGEVDSELEFHLQMRVEELVALGMPEAEARQEALKRFGDLAAARKSLSETGSARARRASRVGWWQDLARDLGFALRGLRRRPGFALIAGATIALGIGLTTTVLAVVNKLVLHPLPYPNAERLTLVSLASEQTAMRITPTLELLGAWRSRSPDREWVEGHNAEELLLERGESAELVQTRSVTPGLLPALGARIILGRGIQPADTTGGAAPVALLAHGTWRKRFGKATDAVGSTLRINGKTTTIVGVVNQGFDLTPLDQRARAEFWLPLGGPAAEKGTSAQILVLRREGVAPAAVSQALRASLASAGITSAMLGKFPPTALDQSAYADPDQEKTLWLLTFAVALVLAVACANVAALLLGQSAARAQEFGVRAALGAGRGRVIRQLITESTVLGAIGGAAGLLVSGGALWVTRIFRPANLLTLDDVALERGVLVMTLGITLLVAVIFGAAPAWAASRTDAASALVGRIRRSFDTRFGRNLRGGLVVGQLAASLVLISGAGILLRSFVRERNLSLGFEAAGLGWVQLDIPEREVPLLDVRRALTQEAARAVAALPGVARVTISGDPPLGYGVLQGEFLIEGRPLPPEGTKTLIPIRTIGGGYFETIGMRLNQGRALDPQPGSTEIVIDAETARRLWPKGDAVGSRVRYSRESTSWNTIVGVAPEQRALVGAFTDAPFILAPMYEQDYGGTLLVRGQGRNPLQQVSAAIRAVDSRIRIRSLVTAESALDERLAGRRFTMTIVSGFAGLALLLAAVGLYGVVALAVSQRTYEIGVRIALGAAPRAVQWMVLRQGAVQIVLGLGLGFGLVVASGRLLRSLLTDVAVWDPLVWLGAGLALAGAGAVACWAPARRASRTDPLIALRGD